MDEILNAITHGVGALLGIIALIVLIVAAGAQGTAWHFVSASIYGATLFLLYLASTLYHGITNKKAKYIFKIFDHAAIYLLIAGTYTPFSLLLLKGALGWTVFGVIWGLAAIGVVLKIFFVNRFKIFSTICYIFMGWLALAFVKPLAAALPLTGLWWLITGGLLYTAGTVFYHYRRFPHNHAVWHLFVLAGSISHFITVLCYVLPLPIHT